MTQKINKIRGVCMCREILNRKRIYLHLTGCPEDYTTKEYDELSWYKKIISFNPRKVYEAHKEQVGISRA